MSIPQYKNDIGSSSIQIGTRNFICIGETPPMNHPHIYLTMGSGIIKTCPYCQTTYHLNINLSKNETIPDQCYHGSIDNIDDVPK
jgi:uncharacterized Zn-finger protein